MSQKHILVPTDFTPAAEKAVSMAIQFAKHLNLDIKLFHLTSAQKFAEAETKISSLASSIAAQNIECTTKVQEGKVVSSIIEEAGDLNAGMIIIGTHGVKGIRQNLFGADALKIAQSTRIPTCIVQDISDIKPINHILFPYGGHDHYEEKIDASITIATSSGSKVSLYAVIKPGVEISPEIRSNIAKVKANFDSSNVDYDEIMDKEESFSIGFSKQIIKYGAKNNSDLIIVMADTSAEFAHFGKADKEALINNEAGIPVMLI